MCARSLKANMVLKDGVNQNPIRLDMAIPAPREFATEWMVPVLSRKGFAFDQDRGPS